jgi:hypothetical protein
MKNISVFILLLFFPLVDLNSQGCCLVGAPRVGVLDYGILSKNSLLINAGYEFYRATKFYSGKKQVVSSLMPIEDKKIHNIYIDLSYAPLNRLTLNMSTNYTQKIRKITPDIVQKSYGIGDLMILGKFSIIAPNIISQREFTIGLGWKIPIGNSSFRLDGVKLSIDMQPTIGSNDKIVWFYFYQAFMPKPFDFFISGTLKLNGTNSDGYKLGREFLLNTGFHLKFKNYLFLTARGRLRYYGSDIYAGSLIPNTGGQWFFVSPEIIYLSENANLRLYLDYPIYLNVKGTQLVPDYAIGFSLGYNLKLK